jgi:hypothetical protein
MIVEIRVLVLPSILSKHRPFDRHKISEQRQAVMIADMTM